MRGAWCAGSGTLRAIFALIHRSAWKGNSPKSISSKLDSLRS
jgi:hypothetical protein